MVYQVWVCLEVPHQRCLDLVQAHTPALQHEVPRARDEPERIANEPSQSVQAEQHDRAPQKALEGTCRPPQEWVACAVLVRAVSQVPRELRRSVVVALLAGCELVLG